VRRVAVAIATFNRVEGLRRLLASLNTMASQQQFSIIVVDNALTPIAESSLAGITTHWIIPIIWLHEPKPGIAAARNRALAALNHYDYVAFVDDDETVRNGWLDELLEVADSAKADVVSANVAYTFESPPPPWALLGGFYSPCKFEELQVVPAAATNNLLLRLPVLTELGVPGFDDRFGLTGGSDILLSRLLASRGARLVWTNRAIVDEFVPVARTSPKWLIRRAIRGGNTEGRVYLVLHSAARLPRLKVLSRGMLRIVVGTALLVTHPCVDNSRRGAEALRVVYRGIGFVLAAASFEIKEYRRPC
jgi:succinoglycan biosynthesis protein ExoM